MNKIKHMLLIMFIMHAVPKEEVMRVQTTADFAVDKKMKVELLFNLAESLERETDALDNVDAPSAEQLAVWKDIITAWQKLYEAYRVEANSTTDKETSGLLLRHAAESLEKKADALDNVDAPSAAAARQEVVKAYKEEFTAYQDAFEELQVTADFAADQEMKEYLLFHIADSLAKIADALEKADMPSQAAWQEVVTAYKIAKVSTADPVKIVELLPYTAWANFKALNFAGVSPLDRAAAYETVVTAYQVAEASAQDQLTKVWLSMHMAFINVEALDSAGTPQSEQVAALEALVNAYKRASIVFQKEEPQISTELLQEAAKSLKKLDKLLQRSKL